MSVENRFSDLLRALWVLCEGDDGAPVTRGDLRAVLIGAGWPEPRPLEPPAPREIISRTRFVCGTREVLCDSAGYWRVACATCGTMAAKLYPGREQACTQAVRASHVACIHCGAR